MQSIVRDTDGVRRGEAAVVIYQETQQGDSKEVPAMRPSVT